MPQAKKKAKKAAKETAKEPVPEKSAAKKVKEPTKDAKKAKKASTEAKKEPEVPVDEDEFVEAEYQGGSVKAHRHNHQPSLTPASGRPVHGGDHGHADEEGRA